MQGCGGLYDALNALKCISEVICVASEITITVFVADCKGEAASWLQSQPPATTASTTHVKLMEGGITIIPRSAK